MSLTITPSEAVVAGAMWSIDEVAESYASGNTATLSTGRHTVRFTDLPGFSKPPDISVTIVANELATASGRYTPASPGEGEGEGETILLPGDVPLEMVWCPSGTFMMGSPVTEQDRNADEGPRHEVTLTQGFWLGKYQFTKQQWTVVMGTTPWSTQGYVLDDPNSPAMGVRWDDAQELIAALNNYTGGAFRLPTEAEWEYACRAGTTTRFYWGDDPDALMIDDYAWWIRNTYYAGRRYAHIVGQKLSNTWGFHDMSGNVWEWCQDWYGSYSSGTEIDPTGPPSGWTRVMRGGSWDSSVDGCRSASRSSYGPDSSDTGGYLGLRLAATSLRGEGGK